MTDQTNQCADHGEIKTCVQRLKSDLKESTTSMAADIKQILAVQEGRGAEFARYIPKAWLWSFFVVLIPAIIIMVKISVYVAAADEKFARKQEIIGHEYRIQAIEKVLLEHHDMMKIVIAKQDEIIGLVKK